MALEMKNACEKCQVPLGNQSQAYICSYECTFCPVCTRFMKGVCPNCGGKLVFRPKRGPVPAPAPFKARAILSEALAKLPTPEGFRFANILEYGSMQLEVYAPRGADPQQPHTRDEVYTVMRGSGKFINGDTSHDFGPGDVLFAPAGIEHRFVDFTDDLAVWVLFYGPEGGEG